MKREATLEDLMCLAFDETWFHVVDGKEEHFFWNADYLGWHKETMKELKPLLGRTFGESFILEVKASPGNPKTRVPMVRVDLDQED